MAKKSEEPREHAEYFAEALQIGDKVVGWTIYGVSPTEVTEFPYKKYKTLDPFGDIPSSKQKLLKLMPGLDDGFRPLIHEDLAAKKKVTIIAEKRKAGGKAENLVFDVKNMDDLGKFYETMDRRILQEEAKKKGTTEYLLFNDLKEQTEQDYAHIDHEKYMQQSYKKEAEAVSRLIKEQPEQADKYSRILKDIKDGEAELNREIEQRKKKH